MHRYFGWPVGHLVIISSSSSSGGSSGSSGGSSSGGGLSGSSGSLVLSGRLSLGGGLFDCVIGYEAPVQRLEGGDWHLGQAVVGVHLEAQRKSAPKHEGVGWALEGKRGAFVQTARELTLTKSFGLAARQWLAARARSRTPAKRLSAAPAEDWDAPLRAGRP
jgi:hypothetical protein